jgi:hypothetical protein
MLRGSKSAAPLEAAAVRVLDEQRVAGYDAVVLEADSAEVLAHWLADHGYAQRPELGTWLAPYVAAKWKLSAFKIAPTGEARAVGTGAVKMSFAADRPFFPYREPSDQRENVPASVHVSERLLRVFFVGTERVEGTIGEARAPWPGKAVWSDRLPSGLLGGIAPAGAWLTMFEDKATPRPGTEDLFFTAASGQTPVKPPPVVWTQSEKIPIPLDVLFLVGLVGWLLWRRRMRRVRGGG